MRSVFVIIYILLSFISLPAQEQKSQLDSLKGRNIRHIIHDRWFGQDKVHHFAVSAFLTGFGYYAAKSEMDLTNSQAKSFSVGFSISFGIAKEIYDGTLKKSVPSFKDLVADLAGTGVGLLILTIR